MPDSLFSSAFQDSSDIKIIINNQIIPNYYSLYNRSIELIENLNTIRQHTDFVDNIVIHGEPSIKTIFNEHSSFCNWNKRIVISDPDIFFNDCDVAQSEQGQTIAELHRNRASEIQSELIQKRNQFDTLFREQFPRLYDLNPGPSPTYHTCTEIDSTSTADIQNCAAVGCLNNNTECELVMGSSNSDVGACTYLEGSDVEPVVPADPIEPEPEQLDAIVYTIPLINCRSNNNCPTICELLDNETIINFWNNFVYFKDALENGEEEYMIIYNYYIIARNLVREEMIPDVIFEDNTEKKRSLIIILFCIIVMIFILPVLLILAIVLLK